MNCKPGDLAVIVRPAPKDQRALGAIVEVLRRGINGAYRKHGLTIDEPTWWCRSSSPMCTVMDGPLTEFVVPDALLRPLRPGDDETADELLHELPLDIYGEPA